jgi:hypothetical protein
MLVVNIAHPNDVSSELLTTGSQIWASCVPPGVEWKTGITVAYQQLHSSLEASMQYLVKVAICAGVARGAAMMLATGGMIAVILGLVEQKAIFKL